MNSAIVEQRLRRFLLITVAGLCTATMIELLLTEHFMEPLQLIPFVLCALGLLAVGAVYFRPSRRTIYFLRAVMILVGLGSLLGIFLHLNGNLTFELEIRPNATAGEVVMDALMGADPLLAPGILALGAALALAATYYHPQLTKREEVN
ncbi:MAG: hypothetical protein K8L99_23150 [Anaerolineae bacterium]|nr:hypothetical protein [Anaerolineae bacterium]